MTLQLVDFCLQGFVARKHIFGTEYNFHTSVQRVSTLRQATRLVWLENFTVVRRSFTLGSSILHLLTFWEVPFCILSGQTRHQEGNYILCPCMPSTSC